MPLIKLPLNPEKIKRVVALDVTKDIPGPGSYTPRVTSINNRYRNTLSINLYTGDRKIELHDKSKLENPGPCQYTLPSDFGPLPAAPSSFVIPRQARAKKNRDGATRSGMMHSMTTTNFHPSEELRQSQTQIQSPRNDQTNKEGPAEIQKGLNSSINMSHRKLVTPQP